MIRPLIKLFIYFSFFSLQVLVPSFAQDSGEKKVKLKYSERVALYKESCERSQYVNCYQLGRLYGRLGEDEPKHLVEAIAIIKQACEEGITKLCRKGNRKACSFNFSDKRDKVKRNKSLEEFSKEVKSCRYLTVRARKHEEFQSKVIGHVRAKGAALIKDACRNGDKTSCKLVNKDKLEQKSDYLKYAGLFLIFLAVFIVMKNIFEEQNQYKAQEKLEDGNSKVIDWNQYGFILKYSRPLFKQYLSPVVNGMKSRKKFKDKHKRKIASAGLTDVLTPEDFQAFKIFLIVGFPVVFLGMREFMEADWPLSYIPFIAAFGYYYPEMWVKGLIQQRQRDVILAMPFIIDMLALSVEAGLDFVQAMTRVIEKAQKTPLSDEFQIMIKEIKIGASRAEALRNMAWRIDLIQISSFCATLIAADSVGASVGPILKALANEVRQKRSSDIEKQAATAATKILFPMMGFIIPAVFIVVAAPIIVEYVAGN